MKMDDETTDVTFKTRHVLGLLEGTVKGVLRRIHHNPNMSWPGHQIAGLGVQDVAELLDSEVEARGTYIGIGEASALVEDVNEMGTIGLGAGAST